MNIFISTWHHLRRSPFQSIGAFTMMIICFFIFSTFIVVSQGLSRVLQYFENKPEITMFLKDGLDKATVETIQKELSAYPSIKEIRFISKEKALSIYQEQNKNNPLLLEMVSASILPASFEISAYDPNILQSIAQNFAGKTNQIDEIVYQKDMIQSLLGWTNVIRQIGLITVVVLATVSFFFIFTVITMKITNRKEEIRISRLLGASGWYISRPFLLEGGIYGFIGVIVGALIGFAIFYSIHSEVNQFFSPVNFISFESIYYLKYFLIELLCGISLGLFASYVGVRRLIRF